MMKDNTGDTGPDDWADGVGGPDDTDSTDNADQLLPETVTDRKTLVDFTTAQLLPLAGVGATSPGLTMLITAMFMPLTAISATQAAAGNNGAAAGNTVMLSVMLVSVTVMLWSCMRQIIYSRRVCALTEAKILADAPSYWVGPLIGLAGYRHQLSVNIWVVTLICLTIFTIIGITGSVPKLICGLILLPVINYFRIRRNGTTQVEQLLSLPTGRREYLQMINGFELQIQKEETDDTLLGMMSQMNPSPIQRSQIRQHRQALRARALADDPLVVTTLIRNEAEQRGCLKEKWF